MTQNAQLLAEAHKALDAWFEAVEAALPKCFHEKPEHVGFDPDGLAVQYCPDCKTVWKN